MERAVFYFCGQNNQSHECSQEYKNLVQKSRRYRRRPSDKRRMIPNPECCSIVELIRHSFG